MATITVRTEHLPSTRGSVDTAAHGTDPRAVGGLYAHQHAAGTPQVVAGARHRQNRHGEAGMRVPALEGGACAPQIR